jgi:hypothetical protein
MSPSEEFNQPGPPDPGAGITYKPVDVNELAREQTKRWMVKFVLWALALQFPIGAIVAIVTDVSWGTVYDALAYTAVGLTGLAGVMGYSYFK